MIDPRHFNVTRIFSLDSKDICSGNTPDTWLAVGIVLASSYIGSMDIVTIPFMCRLAAFLLLLPFALCIGLDIIAYAIARTLRLSMLQARVPGSPSVPESAGSSPINNTSSSETKTTSDMHHHDGQDGPRNSLGLAIDLSKHQSEPTGHTRGASAAPSDLHTTVGNNNSSETKSESPGIAPYATDLNTVSGGELSRRANTRPSFVVPG